MENLTIRNLRNMVTSIKDGFVTKEEIENNEYFYQDSRYYSDESYCITIEGVIRHKDDCYWCDYYEDYTDTENKVYKNRDWVNYSDRAIRNTNLYEYDGDYYTAEALKYHSLVIDCHGEVAHKNDVYYWESDGEYHDEPESENYLFSYHSGNRRDYSTYESKYKIGFEVEKEDLNMLEADDAQYLFDKTGWAKEKDGSLDSETGFELVSPVFDLDIENLKEKLNEVRDYINADYSGSCGGHINLSVKSLNGNETFDLISGYLPLLFALYPSRTNISYSKAKKISTMKLEKEKYQSVAIWDNRIEFRIFPAVRNVENLLWRSKLVLEMVSNPAKTVEMAFYKLNKLKSFKALFQELYGNEFTEKFAALNQRFIKYTDTYENKVLAIKAPKKK